MRRIHSVIFVFSVMLALAAICLVFPEDGIQIGAFRLEWPTLSEVLRGKDGLVLADDTLDTEVTEDFEPERELTPEEKRELAFRKFCHTHPARFFMPDGDSTYLDSFFVDLLSAKDRRIRILHYGDSQIEGDRMTSCLRQHFQVQFGGIGVGLVPAVPPVDAVTYQQTDMPETSYAKWLIYGPKTFHSGDGNYGPMAQMADVLDTLTISIQNRCIEKYSRCRSFTEMLLMASGEGTATFMAPGDTVGRTTVVSSPKGQMQILTIADGVRTHKADVILTGDMQVYGMMLNGYTGVQVDNIGMRGCGGDIFTRISRTSLYPFFASEHVSLIILQFGGNAIPYLKDKEGCQDYARWLGKQVKLFKGLSPQSKILFIGPSDMATNVDGDLDSYPMLPSLVRSLKNMCAEEGIAFWDMRSAMGGKGSIVEWEACRPQYAGEDYVHFTMLGADKMSDLLYECFNAYYNYYLYRNGKLTDEQTDSIVAGLEDIGIKLPNKRKEQMGNNTDKKGKEAVK